METWKDKNVQRVAESLKERMEKGYIKYGTTTERNDLNTLEWLQHLQEELLDAAVYVERLKQDLKQVEFGLNLNDNMNNSFTSYGDTITVSGINLDQPFISQSDVTISLDNQGAAMPTMNIDLDNTLSASFDTKISLDKK